MTIHVLYHKNCTDGTGAAWAAWKALGESNVNYVKVQYSEAFPVYMKPGDHLYLLDFMYPVSVLEQHVPEGCSVTVLDHHVSQKPEWEKLVESQTYNGWIVDGEFSLEHSGAVLTWNWFHPGKQPPELLLHIEDRDLWKFKLADTKDVIAGLTAIKDFDKFEVFDLFANADGGVDEAALTMEYLKTKGKTINDKNDQVVETFARKGSNKIKVTVFEGHKTALYNTTTLISEIGAGVLRSNQGFDVSLSFFVTSDFKVVFNLRSNSEVADVDVSAIAKKYGGGGHKNAAGFTLNAQEGFAILDELFNN